MILRYRKNRSPQSPQPGDFWLDVEYDFTIKVNEYEKVFLAAEDQYVRGAIGLFKNNATGSISPFALPSKAFVQRIKEGQYVLLVRKGVAHQPGEQGTFTSRTIPSDVIGDKPATV